MKCWPRKPPRALFGKLQSRRLDHVVCAESAVTRTGSDRYDHLGLRGKTVHPFFFGMAIHGLEHAGAGRTADDRSFDQKDVEGLPAGKDFLQELFMVYRGNVGQRGMPEKIDVQVSK